MKAKPQRRPHGGAQRARVASNKTITAPVGGLNALNAIAEMPETDALVLDNWLPRTSDVVTRNGYQTWSTGLPGSVDTILAYRTGTAQKLFGIASGSVYDVTTQGAVGAPMITGLSNSRWQYVDFGTPGGRFLVMVNGVDNLRLYDGAAWSTITAVSSPVAITGVDTSLLINVESINSRLWFVEKNSLRCWYLPLNSIGGAASVLDLSSLSKLGGTLAGVFGWSVTSIYGNQNYVVFITSEGEIFVYQGYDPTNAATWGLSARGRVGRPVGNRFWQRIGPDVGIICADGLVPVSKAMQIDREANNEAISYKIINLLNNDAGAYPNNFGWQIQLYPPNNLLIVNVPAPDGAYQYVMNTVTKAWCRYTNLNATCFEFLNDKLFFGGQNNRVYQAEYGNTDDGAAIVCQAQQAFSYFGEAAALKMFTGIRPVITSTGLTAIGIGLDMDFENKVVLSTPTLSPTALPLFWSFPWGANWGAQVVVNRGFQFASGVGYAAAVKLKVSVKFSAVSWQATSVAFQPGGVF